MTLYKWIFSLIFVSFSLQTSWAQPQLLGSFAPFSDSFSVLNHIEVTPQQNIYLSGYKGDSLEKCEGILLKYTKSQELLWKKDLHFGNSTLITALFVDAKEGVIALVRTQENKKASNYWLHYNAQGDLLTQTQLDTNFQWFSPITRLRNNNYLIGLHKLISKDSSSYTKSGMAELTEKGDVIWKNTYTKPNTVISDFTFLPLPNQQICWLATYQYPLPRTETAKNYLKLMTKNFLIKVITDEKGKEIARDTFVNAAYISQLLACSDGNVLLIGQQDTDPREDNTEFDIYTEKIDPITWKSLWVQVFHVQQNDHPISAKELENGNYMLSAYCGGSWVTNANHTATFELQAENGNILWSKVFRDGNLVQSLANFSDGTYKGVGIFSDAYLPKEEGSFSQFSSKPASRQACLLSFSGNSTIWMKTYPSELQPYCFKKNPKGGYWAAGIDFSGNHIFLCRISETGEILQHNKLGRWSASFDVPVGLATTQDGAGWAFNNREEFFKISPQNQILEAIEPCKFRNIGAIQPMGQQDFLVTGFEWKNYPEKDFWWGILNEKGITKQEQTRTLPYAVEVWGMVQTTDNEYIALCEAGEVENPAFALIKLSASGKWIWEKRLEIGREVNPCTITACSDNSFVLTGVSKRDGQKYKATVLKTDAEGNVLWDLELVKTDKEIATVVATCDEKNNVILAATHKYNSYKGEQEIYVAKISPAGKILWEKFMGGAGSHQVGGIALTDDNQILITGHTSHFPQKDIDAFYLLKVRND